MSFSGFLDGFSGGGARLLPHISYGNHLSPSAAGAIAPPQPGDLVPPLAKSMFSSPGLSLGLQMNVENNGAVARGSESIEVSAIRRSREEEPESRSGSDNAEGFSGDDHDAADRPPRKKRYHRHTPQQIQELESVFKECPHPDEKQRLELSRRLSLDPRQIKFWFQNRRTQMKTQLERHENSLLRHENDKLRSENMSIREAMRNPICGNCGGPAVLGEVCLEEQHLRIENARLKDELDRVCALAGKFLGRPIPSVSASHPLPDSALELGVGSNAGFSLAANAGFEISVPGASLAPVTRPPSANAVNVTGLEHRPMYLELALSAMDELVKMAQAREPLWVRSSECGREVLNRDEYDRTFSSCVGPKREGFVLEASREVGMVIINSLALVETLMDSERWADMFPCMIARTSTTEIISSGVGGTRSGALQLMQAELQLLSPLVPARRVSFLRFCKQQAEGVWAVVDVSIDGAIRDSSAATVSGSPSCRRLPSGCLVQDMPNGYSKVTWVEHAEYDESQIHHTYRPLVRCGLAFGAHRWVTSLQRQCEFLTILMSSSPDHSPISSSGRKSMLKLAQRMTDNFCGGVCASSAQKWSQLNVGNIDEDVRIMTRKSVDDPGEPPGIVLSAATSVWLPETAPRRLFDFLRDERLRSEWDILSNGGPMQEMAHIAKGQDHSNCVSLLRVSAMNANESSMLILQETSIDPAGALVVYAPVDIPAMHVVMNGGDSAYVALLPSGFAILPDSGAGRTDGEGGSLLTVAFQILVNSLPTAKLTVESVDTVNNLISCTVQKIRAALSC
ncbi:PREDICTED: LOW QUALITY PROTEIN: homeobox-leucine zipper protein HDG1 [Tarenaya hassleriana]|uniref:LOW QUALITY PROTEIN: homeobox-leucine zipper protein HDG1 n=1 Tax=Tarenaya hassleriana TaxID=28532 RepID=UPI0008FD5DFD|nr:PREDICTED: LOW QUALITY PROTEIN: homeobox-leucine zipper protein HDG1 [Tarenaya hassleriana]